MFTRALFSLQPVYAGFLRIIERCFIISGRVIARVATGAECKCLPLMTIDNADDFRNPSFARAELVIAMSLKTP